MAQGLPELDGEIARTLVDTEPVCDEGTALEVEKRDDGEEPGMDLVSVNCALRLLR